MLRKLRSAPTQPRQGRRLPGAVRRARRDRLRGQHGRQRGHHRRPGQVGRRRRRGDPLGRCQGPEPHDVRRLHLPRRRRGRQHADRGRHQRGNPRDRAVLGAGRAWTRRRERQRLRAPAPATRESSTFVNCDIVATLNLSRPARVLVIGSVLANSDSVLAEGKCLLGTTSGSIPGSDVFIRVQDHNANQFREVEHVAMSGVTGVFPAGQHSFGVDCHQLTGDIRIHRVQGHCRRTVRPVGPGSGILGGRWAVNGLGRIRAPAPPTRATPTDGVDEPERVVLGVLAGVGSVRASRRTR